MAKPATTQLDIYGAHLHVAPDHAAWGTLQRKWDMLADPGDCDGMVELHTQTTDAGREAPHLFVFINTSTHPEQRDLVNTVAHESTHAAAGLLDHIGQTPGNSEALAYLVGWIASFVWEACAA